MQKNRSSTSQPNSAKDALKKMFLSNSISPGKKKPKTKKKCKSDRSAYSLQIWPLKRNLKITINRKFKIQKRLLSRILLQQ